MTNANDATSPSYIEGEEPDRGLTKREYFAALNHAAFISAAAFNQDAEDMMVKAGVKTGDIRNFIASMAVDAADALIEELNK